LSQNIHSPNHPSLAKMNTQVPQKKIGKDIVSALGLGLMGYAPNDDPAEAEKRMLDLMTKAADLGYTCWDTSNIYGPFTSEELIGKWFKLTGRRKEIFLATKFGISDDPVTKKRFVRGDKEYVRECIEGSLKRLQTDYVDLYYQHRVDPNTRIEETVEAMAELVKEGRVRYLGLSECSERTLRRAHKIHPIAAVQVEYSLFALDIEKEEIGIKKACEELGVTLVAYSPLGRGMLTGVYKSRADFDADDRRLLLPRFSEENFANNFVLVDHVSELAKKKGCSPGQLALAWLLKQGDNVIPIPGTRHIKYLEENWEALKVELTEGELREIRKIAESVEVKGSRNLASQMPILFGDSKE